MAHTAFFQHSKRDAGNVFTTQEAYDILILTCTSIFDIVAHILPSHAWYFMHDTTPSFFDVLYALSKGAHFPVFQRSR